MEVLGAIVVGFILVVVRYFINDSLTHVFPDILRKIAWKRLSKLDIDQDIKVDTFKGFISDCEHQKSSTKKYMLMIQFIYSINNVETPKRVEGRAEKK